MNKTYYDFPISFSPSVIRLGMPFTNTQRAFEVSENGDVTLRFPAPGTKKMRVNTGRFADVSFDVEMTKDADGVFSCVLPASLGLRGNTMINFIADGSNVLNPYLPVEHYGDKQSNCLELPDPGMEHIEIKDVQHGTVTREIFWSDAVQNYVRCMVYLPPCYHEGGTYPVLYLQHGAGENETSWMYSGKVPQIMDNLIHEGKAVPFIVVTNDGMLRKPGQNGICDFEGIEEIVTRECRKVIEMKYRCYTDKWNRAICGLSLGSMFSCYAGLRNPELYGWLGTFTFLRCIGKDVSFEGNPHLDLLKKPEKFAEQYKLLFRSIGSDEVFLKEFEEDDEFIAQCGIDKLPGYVRKVYENEDHVWNNWRRAYCDFAQMVFK